MKLPAIRDRRNELQRGHEVWKPPVFQPSRTWMSRCAAALRRFADLQASSIWNDLSCLLPVCQGSVLDVGCGAQPYRSLLPKEVSYSGIDTEDAGKRFGYSVPDTTYFSGSNWPVASNNVDLVLATETLEHIENPDQFLREACRVLRPEGWILLTVPFSARWHYIPWDYWRFTPSGLSVLLERCGFEKPVVYGRGNEITVACYKVLAVLFMLILGDIRSPVRKCLARFTGILCLPAVFVLCLTGQISLRMHSGPDCLGYTVLASVRPDHRENLLGAAEGVEKKS
jgi:SAM-dependent methyltransferase